VIDSDDDERGNSAPKSLSDSNLPSYGVTRQCSCPSHELLMSLIQRTKAMEQALIQKANKEQLDTFLEKVETRLTEVETTLQREVSQLIDFSNDVLEKFEKNKTLAK
jgi:hypothetical protein